MDKVINLRISAELLEQLDHERGLIPRSAYLRDLVEKALSQSDKPQPVPVKPKSKPASKPSAKGANQLRALEIQGKLKALINELSSEQRLAISSHRYPKSELFKALNEEVSKDSIAKYWSDLVLPLLDQD